VPEAAPEAVANQGGWELAPLFALVVLLSAWAVWRLVAMCLFDRLITLGELAAVLAVFAALVTGAIATGDGVAAVLLIVNGLLALAVLVLPAASEAVIRRRMLREDIARLQAWMRKQPDVAQPHRKLAEIYEAQEDWERAIEHYHAYLELHEHSAEVALRLEHCLDVKRRHDLGLRRCPLCGTDNPAEMARCGCCGRYLEARRELMDALTTPPMLRIWRWAMVLLLAGGSVGLVLAPAQPVTGLTLLALAGFAMLIFVYGRMHGPGR